MLQRQVIPLRAAASPAPLPRNGKRFHVWTIGCQMNEADSAKIAATLQEAGYSATPNEQDADIVILNSCVVRQAAEDKVAGKLNSLIRLKRERPDSLSRTNRVHGDESTGSIARSISTRRSLF